MPTYWTSLRDSLREYFSDDTAEIVESPTGQLSVTSVDSSAGIVTTETVASSIPLPQASSRSPFEGYDYVSRIWDEQYSSSWIILDGSNPVRYANPPEGIGLTSSSSTFGVASDWHYPDAEVRQYREEMTRHLYEHYENILYRKEMAFKLKDDKDRKSHMPAWF